MTTSIIGLFESAEFAKKVLGELARIGCKKDAMEILQDASTDQISDRLIEAGYEDDKARRYADALQKGGALVVAETDDDKADDALDTMRRLGALSPEALIERIDARSGSRAGNRRGRIRPGDRGRAGDRQGANDRRQAAQSLGQRA